MFKPNDIVYISGPMSKHHHWNFPKFFGIEATLRHDFGCRVLNPAREESGLSWEQYMTLDRAKVEVCTHILMLENWELSRGACQEKDWAETMGKTVIYEYEIKQWQCGNLAAVAGSENING